MPRTKLNRAPKEKGLAAVWVFVVLGILFGISALAIDITHILIIRRQLQNAADAAAIAASRELNGTVKGWQLSKRAAIAILKAQSVTSLGSLQDLPPMTEGALDPMEALEKPAGLYSEYRGNHITKGDITLTFERGVYWHNRGEDENDKSPLRFYSLEEGTTPIGLANPVVGLNGKLYEVSGKNNLPVFHMASAVRVIVETKGIQTWFAHLLGAKSLQTQTSAIAASTSTPVLPVAPFAIPACSLLLDGDPKQEARYDVTSFSGQEQCGRELVFSEADPLGGTNRTKRVEGIIRSVTYPRSPDRKVEAGHNMCNDMTSDGVIANCKAIPLTGVIGVPSAENDSSPAKPDEVMSFLSHMASGIHPKAALGMRFRPLEDGVKFFDDYENGATNALYQLFLKSDTSFHSVFYSQAEAAARPQRWQNAQESGLSYSFMRFLMDTTDVNPLADVQEQELSGEEFMNPLCQTESVNFVNGKRMPIVQGEGQPAQVKKVVPMRVMVIAPGRDGEKYCDFSSVFERQSRDSEPPLAETEPIVVGFVDAYVFDFNFRNYDNVYKVKGTSGYVKLPEYLNDYNPKRMDLRSLMPAMPKFDYENPDRVKDCWKICSKKPEECPSDCFDIDPPPTDAQPLISPEWYNKTKECYNLPDYGWALMCHRAVTGTSGNLWELLTDWYGCLEVLKTLNQEGTLTQEAIDNGWKCLPERKTPCQKKEGDHDFVCWDPPEPKAAQYGCGGVRARISCQGNQISSPMRNEFQRPMLVR